MKYLFAALFLSASTMSSVRAADPVIQHAPVTAAIRAVPVVINAEVTCDPGATITLAEVLVRVTDAGTPVRIPMSASGNSYSATIPVSMIEGVNVFWYSINVKDNLERVSSTRWLRVIIAEGADSSGGGKAASNLKKWSWTGAALLLGTGAGVLWEHHNDDGNDGPAPVEDTPAPSQGGGPAKPACQSSGTVNIVNTDPDCGPIAGRPRAALATKIEVSVCTDCNGGTVRVNTTWGGDEVVINNYDNSHCGGSPILIDKPVGSLPLNSEMIRVFVNGKKLAESPFPTSVCPAID